MKWLFLKVKWYRTELYKIDIICFVAPSHHNPLKKIGTRVI